MYRSILDEICMINIHSVEETYQHALKVEEKLNRKKKITLRAEEKLNRNKKSNSQGRGRFSRGRGKPNNGKVYRCKKEEVSTLSASMQEGKGRG